MNYLVPIVLFLFAIPATGQSEAIFFAAGCICMAIGSVRR